MVISLEEINPFERLYAPSRAKSRTNDVTSMYHLRHFGTSQMVKTDIFVNVIYKLIYLLLKIQEIFPSGLANLVNKLVHALSFVYLICNSREKYFLYRCNSFIVDIPHKFTVRDMNEIPVFVQSIELSNRT